MKIAGFDIGGANTDLAIIDFEDGEIKTYLLDPSGLEWMKEHMFKFYPKGDIKDTIQ